jgi:hypothetical protein
MIISHRKADDFLQGVCYTIRYDASGKNAMSRV